MTSLVAGVSDVITAGYMCVFSCANDHQDVRGETVIMKHLLGANFLLEPTKSPFAACRCAYFWVAATAPPPVIVACIVRVYAGVQYLSCSWCSRYGLDVCQQLRVRGEGLPRQTNRAADENIQRQGVENRNSGCRQA
jgi:hypothetical protein